MCVDRVFARLNETHLPPAFLGDMHRVPISVSSEVFFAMPHFSRLCYHLFDRGLSMWMQRVKLEYPTLLHLASFPGLEHVVVKRFVGPADRQQLFAGVTSLELEHVLDSEQLDGAWVSLSNAFPNVAHFKFGSAVSDMAMDHAWIAGRVFPRLESLRLTVFTLVLRGEAEDTHRRPLRLFHCDASVVTRDVSSLMDPSTIESFRSSCCVRPDKAWWDKALHLRDLDLPHLCGDLLDFDPQSAPMGMRRFKVRFAIPFLNVHLPRIRDFLAREGETLCSVHLHVSDWTVFAGLTNVTKLSLNLSLEMNFARLPNSVRILEVHCYGLILGNAWELPTNIERLILKDSHEPMLNIIEGNNHLLSTSTITQTSKSHIGVLCEENREWFEKRAHEDLCVLVRETQRLIGYCAFKKEQQ